MKLPRAIFSNWTHWTNRAQIGGIVNPGVYVLAHFAKPPNSVDLQSSEIVYIGETHDQTLRIRWDQFHRCAFEGKEGHSGGITYWNRFKGRKFEQLYVAAFPVNSLSIVLRSVFIRYIERELIMKYVLKWNELPKCNSG